MARISLKIAFICIYDVCHAGETQAELAAELLAATKAD